MVARMSEYPNLDLFHARMAEVPEWTRKLIGDMMLKLDSNRRTELDLRAKLEVTKKENELLKIGKGNAGILLEACQNQYEKLEQERDNLQAQIEAANTRTENIIDCNKRLVCQLNQQATNFKDLWQTNDNLQAANGVLRSALGKTKLSVLKAYREKALHDRIHDLIIFGIVNPALETTLEQAGDGEE